MDEVNYSEVYSKIKNQCVDYLINNHIKSIVIGISGGIDSALNAVLMHYICKDERLNIPLIGRYIGIEGNKEEEEDRAIDIGTLFCDDFFCDNLTDLYKSTLNSLDDFKKNPSFEDKIRRGNIKARLRMIYLRDLAQKNHGLLVDNDNKTENELGFWTLDGDVGDIVPLEGLWKTQVFGLAEYVYDNILKNEHDKEVLMACIKAVPTDGLGITNSDIEQLGAQTYEQVDYILSNLIPIEDKYKRHELVITEYEYQNRLTEEKKKINIYNDKSIGYDKYGKEDMEAIIDNIWNRHLKSQFKRDGKFIIKL